MIYQIDNMSLNCIREVFRCDANDVCICRDINASAETCYTLLIVKDHELARTIIANFEETKHKLPLTAPHPEGFMMVFPYHPERELSRFYIGSLFTNEDCEKICANLIIECMSADMPYPFLSLILKQGKVNLGKDCSVSFGYELDLSLYDTSVTERDCVSECASIVLKLLEPKAQEKALSYELMCRKVPHKGYQRFAELFHDVKITTEAETKTGVTKRAKALVRRNMGRFFKIFIVLCGILVAITLLMLITQLFTGDMPLFRIFSNPFKEIGTESMLQ